MKVTSTSIILQVKKYKEHVLGKINDEIKTSIIIFLLAILIVVTFSIFYLYFTDNPSVFGNILIEAHGMLLDILVFGIIVLFLNSKREKRILIQSYKDQIDDFKGWNSPEAGHRIRGSIKRLNKLGYSEIYLTKCFLSGIDLSSMNLRKAYISFSDLNKASLSKANLQEAVFWNTKVHGVYFDNANLIGAHLMNCDLTGSSFWGADLKNANLTGAILNDCIFYNSRLSETIGLTVEQLCMVKTLYKSELPEELKIKLQKAKPSILEESSYRYEYKNMGMNEIKTD